MSSLPNKVFLIDIDGLRPDVLRSSLASGELPNIGRLLSNALDIRVTAPAPSITFCSQASLFTGAHPGGHGIPGNQFFDRFGEQNGGVPRHFAFDVGDTLAVDDAVRVFTDGLAGKRLQVPTMYERVARNGGSSIVAGNMYAKGASEWLRPSLADLARFTKGGNLFGLDSRTYDQQILDGLVHSLRKNGLPDLTTMYFMGLDHDSHAYGPEKGQRPYLVEHVDSMVGQLWQVVEEVSPDDLPLVALFSDHGQIEVVPDDRHSLKIGFPFDKEMGHLFTALGLDVHDFPGEDPNCDAVMALNGGLAYVYLQKKDGHWADKPRFKEEVLPVALAFWAANQTGQYAEELKSALAGVLVRDVERNGWEAGFSACAPDGRIVSLDAWFASRQDNLYLDPVNRLRQHVGRFSGDILLITRYEAGFYFGSEINGVHGGLHPEDSSACLFYNWPGAGGEDWGSARAAIRQAVERRCKAENGRMPATADLLTGLEGVVGLLKK